MKNDPNASADPQETAIAVLSWLAAQPDMLGRFLSLSGMRADQLREAAAKPGFFAALIEFLMNHEPSLMAFCSETGTRPEAVVAAARAFGADSSAWGDFQP
jgi:hypothetical protein